MSEQSLEKLIASLKTEAIDAAESESNKIITAAKEEAEKIVKEANERKSKMLQQAEKEASDILKKGKVALQQAGRDYSISVRNELLNIFKAVLTKDINKAFSPDLLKEAIGNIIENVGSDVEIKLSSENAENLADYIHSRLYSSEQTTSIIADNAVLNGFAISKKEEGWSYSISPEDVSEALAKHLNKNWLDILKTE